MDFTKPKTMRDCWIVNDGVMGGVSQSALRQDTQGMYFEGLVSLENNGGFASMRSLIQFPQGTQGIELLAKGDGKQYKLILRTALAPRVNYAADFIAEPSWQTHQFNLNQFKLAVHYFKKVIIMYPLLDVYKNISVCYVNLKEYKNAENTLNKAYNIENNDLKLLKMFINLYYFQKKS